MYFKVLKKGKSFNGGSYTWSLPSKMDTIIKHAGLSKYE